MKSGATARERCSPYGHEVVEAIGMAELGGDQREQARGGDLAEKREAAGSLGERGGALGGVHRKSGVQHFIRGAGAAPRQRGGIAPEQLETLFAADREVARLDREHRAEIREIENPQRARRRPRPPRRRSPDR